MTFYIVEMEIYIEYFRKEFVRSRGSRYKSGITLMPDPKTRYLEVMEIIEKKIKEYGLSF